MFSPVVFLVITLVLLYLTYRVLKIGKGLLKYLFAAILIGIAFVFFQAMIKYTTPSSSYFH